MVRKPYDKISKSFAVQAAISLLEVQVLYVVQKFGYTGNALARVQRVHKPADLWDITFCTRWFWGFYYYAHPLFWDPELSRMRLPPQILIPNAFPDLLTYLGILS